MLLLGDDFMSFHASSLSQANGGLEALESPQSQHSYHLNSETTPGVSPED